MVYIVGVGAGRGLADKPVCQFCAAAGGLQPYRLHKEEQEATFVMHKKFKERLLAGDSQLSFRVVGVLTMFTRHFLLAALLALAALPACGGREPAPAGPAGPEVRQLKVLTYNVLADRGGAQRRLPALLKVLEDADADVLALQEVTDWFREVLAGQPGVEKKYGKVAAGAVSPNGQLILARFPAEKSFSRPLPGRQGRDAAVAVFLVNGRRLAVATTHLESPLEAGETRARQLAAVFSLLEDADDAILLGDLNFAEGGQPETARLDPRFADLWPSLKPGDPGFTWDVEKSEMARQGSFPGEKSGRIDRILVRSGRWAPKSVRIVGDAPIVPGDRSLFPSDHFGVEGVLEWRP